MKRRERTKANIIDRLIIIFLPIILGVVGTIVIKCLYGKYILIEAEDGLELVKTVFDVWGILLGFIFTAVSILLTIGENSFVNILLETNHMQNIIFSYVISGLLLLISIVFALVLMFVKIWNTFVLYVFIGINIAIIVSIAICVCVLFKIILNMNK